MPEVVRCPVCIAPLPLDKGPIKGGCAPPTPAEDRRAAVRASIAQCRYCGAQSRLDAPGSPVARGTASGSRLADAVSFVTPTRTIPWLEKGAALPIHRTETLSTQRDDQAALDVHLVQGGALVTRFSFPIEKRGPRGVPRLALTVRVAADGAMSVTVTEPGSSHALDRDNLRVRVD